MSTYSTPSLFSVYIALSLYSLSLLKYVSNYFIAWCHPTHFSFFLLCLLPNQLNFHQAVCSGNFIISRAAVNFYYDFKFSCSPVFVFFQFIFMSCFSYFFFSFFRCHGVWQSLHRWGSIFNGTHDSLNQFMKFILIFFFVF